MTVQIYEKILVPVDGSATSAKGLQEAIKIAKALGSTLRLLHVVDELIVDYSGVGAGTNYYCGRRRRRSARRPARRSSRMPKRSCAAAVSKPRRCWWKRSVVRRRGLIVAQAQEWPADLIVMGTHGRRGIRRLALGSDAEHVMRASTVPVLLVRSAPECNATSPLGHQHRGAFEATERRSPVLRLRASVDTLSFA